MDECMEWAFECRKVFPTLDKFSIEAGYAKTPKNALGRVKGIVKAAQDFDAIELLLTGIKKSKNSKKLEEKFTIEINQEIKKVEPEEIRKMVVQHILMHELLHIENKDLLTLSKQYRKRKTKKIHKKEFEEEMHKRYNELRRLNGLPEIKNAKDANMAVNKIAGKILEKQQI